MSWICPICSTNNDNNAKTCIVCDAERPKSALGFDLNAQMLKVSGQLSKMSAVDKRSPEERYAEAKALFRSNPSEGFSKMLDSARDGIAEAQYLVGYEYYRGKIVDKDYGEAIYWLDGAAKQGIVDAQCFLGICYLFADGDYQKNARS